MLHTKFRPAGSGEDFFFYHKWAWRSSWSCDPDFTIKLSFPLSIDYVSVHLGKKFKCVSAQVS